MSNKLEKLTAEDGKSLDLEAENVEQLKQLFPDVFRENKVDFNALKAVLGEHVEDKEERYNFTWHGKNKARQIAQTPSTGTLRPCKEESVNWDSTHNLFIEGDNLEVLKLLQKSYHQKIKMIYIDPPYNTGKDFVYKDSFQDNLDNYLKQTNQLDSKGIEVSVNSDTVGRYHSNWLTMMYPRLKLARNLLQDDGVIFISIGEQEIHNLRKICDEIFGENNFIGQAGRISKKASNQGNYWSPNFDYVLTYAKNVEFCQSFFGGINYNSYKEIETEGEREGEKYQLIRLYMTSLDPMRGCSNQRYYIECPDGTFVIPPGETFPETTKDGEKVAPRSGKDKVWRWSQESYLAKKQQIVVKRVKSSNLVDQDGNPAKWNVFTKTYLNDVIEKSTASPNNFIENHINQKASHELKALGIPFDFAKPSSLMQFLMETCRVDNGDTVLDFFGGSGSTAHSAINYSIETGKKVRFIHVQLPEATDTSGDEFKEGYKNIAQIGSSRIKKVIEAKTGESGSVVKSANLGFKYFKLDSTNINPWDSSPLDLDDILENAIDSLKEGRSQIDVLFEIILKYGLDLTYPINEHQFGENTVYDVAFGSLIICLEDNIPIETVEYIGKLKQELNSELTRVVFKDAGFASDAVKVNAVQLLKQYGIDDVKSI